MTYPVALWLTKQPKSEIPFTVVLYAAVLVFARTIAVSRRWTGYLLGGVFVGCAMLIRPIAIRLGVAFCGPWLGLLDVKRSSQWPRSCFWEI